MAIWNAHYLGPVGVGTIILRAAELAVFALTLHFGRVQTTTLYVTKLSDAHSERFPIRVDRNGHHLGQIGGGTIISRPANSALVALFCIMYVAHK